MNQLLLALDAFPLAVIWVIALQPLFLKKIFFFDTSASTLLSKDMFENLRPEPDLKKKVAAVSEVSLRKIDTEFLGELKQGFVFPEGSNAWVLSGKRSKVVNQFLEAPDPHVAFATPGVWFEAHIRNTNHEIYGHYLPLIPFSALWSVKHIPWSTYYDEVDRLGFLQEKCRLTVKS